MTFKRFSYVAAVVVASMVFAGCAAAKPPEPASSDLQSEPTGLPTRVSAAIATGHGPYSLYVTTDALYVANHRGGTIQRIDPATNLVVSTIQVGGELEINELSGVGDVVWACTNVDSVLHRIDLSTGTTTATVPAQCELGLRNVIDGRLWQAPGLQSHEILVLDFETGKTLQKIPVDTDIWWGLPVRAGSRVAIPNGNGIMLCQLDGTKCDNVNVAAFFMVPIAGKLYRLPESGALAEIDPTNLAVLKTIQVSPHYDTAIALTADDSGNLYYRSDFETIYRIDTTTGKVEKLMDKLPWAEFSSDMLWAFGSLWVTNFSDDTVWRIDTSM